MPINHSDKTPTGQALTNLNEDLTQELLHLILQELRISNAYNAIMHDETITSEDLEDEYN